MSQPRSATDPDRSAVLRRAGLRAEDVANDLLAAAQAAPSSAQMVALDALSYVMAGLSAILCDLANTWD